MTHRAFPHSLIYLGLLLAGTIGCFVALNHIRTLESTVSSSQQKVHELESKVSSLGAARCSTQYAWQAATTYSFSLTIDDRLRTYHIRTPVNYSPSVRTPLIVAFDGIDGSGRNIESYAGLDGLPSLIAYPDSVVGKRKLTAWQGAPYSAEGVNDVQFTREILDTIRDSFCVDTSNIFAVGMSNGGGFAWLAACHIADIKAIATVSAAHYSQCATNRPVSILAFHSMADKAVPIEGSKYSGLIPTYVWMSGKAADNGCHEQPITLKTKDYTKTTWRACHQGGATELIRLPRQRHGWLAAPPAAADTYLRPKNTAQYIWQFFTTRA